MPQFYVHLCTPEGRSDDTVGCSFTDLETAFLDAHRAVIDISAEMLRNRQDPMGCAFEICGGDGEILLTLKFEEVLRPKPKPVHDLSVLQRRVERNIARGKGLKVDLEEGLAEVRRNLEALRDTVRQT